MHEINENIRGGLDTIGEMTEIVLNALSLLCIIAGVVFALKKSLQQQNGSARLHPLHTNFRMLFGGWLVVALELLLAADIVGTIISPTPANLIELGAIALIRTFLNYFLKKELLEDRERWNELNERKKAEQPDMFKTTISPP